MDNSRQSDDSPLDGFDAWLRSAAVEPPPDFVARIRTRLRETPDMTDAILDELFLPDPTRRDADMVARVRQRLVEPVEVPSTSLIWFRWLTPLAAAATLTFAFIGFHSRAPQAVHQESIATSTIPVEAPAAEEDTQLTQIFALATNLHGTVDMTKLESVENLAFLFD